MIGVRSYDCVSRIPAAALVGAFLLLGVGLGSEVHAASVRKECTTYGYTAGGSPPIIYRTIIYASRVSCRGATAIVKDFLRMGSDVVGHNTAGPRNGASWTLRRYPGWRCVTGAGGGACIRRNQTADYAFGQDLSNVAKSFAHKTLHDFDAAGHKDPFLNVPDDEQHSDGGAIACKPVRAHVDCQTMVTFTEDAYHYEIDNGVPYVVYAADRVVWTMRFEWGACSRILHICESFPQAPEAPTWGGAPGFGGRALHRTRTAEKDVCGSPGYPCSFVPYPG